MKEHEYTLAFAESMTCGILSATIGNVNGTSDFFKGSIVCYDESVKKDILNIRQKDLETWSAESQEITDSLAKNLRTIIPADVCGAITGLAAPGGSENARKPVGTVFFSVYHKKELHSLRKVFRGTPLQIKKKAVDAMFLYICDILNKSQ